MTRQRWTISVDAMYDPVTGYAAIAGVVTDRDVRLLFAEIVEVATSTEAEMRALLEAMEIANRAHFGRATFRSDNESVVRWMNGNRRPRTKGHELDRPLARARELLEGRSWEIKHIPRKWNASAHTQCSQAFKCFRAGLEKKPTKGAVTLPDSWRAKMGSRAVEQSGSSSGS